MQVSSGQIRVKASDSKGLFYGLQNLRLLLPPAIESSTAQDTVEWTVPEMTVKDAPRFGYRGFMLDVSRYFLPKEELLRMIDCMALLKLNRLHLHLTDDNGWRLEIKKYPKLTEVGAWKVDRQHLPFPERRNPKRGEPATVGGYYTQADMKEIIAYAADRQIEIIPEIDIPAHSNAALASYPEYACPVVKDFIGVIPGLGGKTRKSSSAEAMKRLTNSCRMYWMKSSRCSRHGISTWEATKRPRPTGRNVRSVRPVSERNTWQTRKPCRDTLWGA